MTVLGTLASAMDALRGNAPSRASPASSDWGQCVDPGRLFWEAASPCECRGQASKMRLFIYFHRPRLPSWTISLNLKKLPLLAVYFVVQFWWKWVPLAFVFSWKHLYLLKKSTVRYNLHLITCIYISWTVEWALTKVSIHVTTMTIKIDSTSTILRSPPSSGLEVPGHRHPAPGSS